MVLPDRLIFDKLTKDGKIMVIIVPFKVLHEFFPRHVYRLDFPADKRFTTCLVCPADNPDDPWIGLPKDEHILDMIKNTLLFNKLNEGDLDYPVSKELMEKLFLRFREYGPGYISLNNLEYLEGHLTINLTKDVGGAGVAIKLMNSMDKGAKTNFDEVIRRYFTRLNAKYAGPIQQNPQLLSKIIIMIASHMYPARGRSRITRTA